MTHIIEELERAFGHKPQQVAAGPAARAPVVTLQPAAAAESVAVTLQPAAAAESVAVTLQPAAAAESVASTLGSILSSAGTTLKQDFEDLGTLPVIIRQRIAEAAAKLRAARDEIESFAQAVETDAAQQVDTARQLFGVLRQVQAPAQPAASSVAQSATGAALLSPTLTNGTGPIVDPVTTDAVREHLAKLGATVADPSQSKGTAA